LFAYDASDFSIPPENYLKGMNTSFLLEDHEQNIWIGTFGDGVYMLPSWHKTVRNYSTLNGLRSNNVTCVTRDLDGNVNVGLNTGTVNVITDTGVSLFDTRSNGVNGNRIICMAFGDGGCWIGSDDNLRFVPKSSGAAILAYIKRPGTPPIGTSITIKDLSFRGGRMAVAASHGAYEGMSSPQRPADMLLRNVRGYNGRIYAIFLDDKGTTWYSSVTGLHSFRDGSETAHASEDPALRLRITDIAATSDGALVLATYGYGVLFYKAGRILRWLTTTNGLSGNTCRKIFVHEDDVFLATSEGVTRLRWQGGKVTSVRTYTRAQGLLSNDVNDVFADDRELCVATSSGLTVLPLKDAASAPQAIPPLTFTGITAGGEKIDPDSSYTFRHHQNALSFTFSTPSFQSPDEIVYQYRIKDGQSWKTARQGSLNFPFLPPGNYHFQLRARIKDGPWSETKSFYFTITPPFWKTTWFEVLGVLVLAGVVYLLFRWRRKVAGNKQMEERQIERQIMNLEQQALQSMMNPHFVFNVMNSIQHFMNANDKHTANIYLSDFARLIRMNLDLASKSMISLEEEISYLNLYLSLERQRVGTRLGFSIEVDEDIDCEETMIPVMLLQPFVENAIWHGISGLKEEGHIAVRISRKNASVILVQIIDNGLGMAGNGSRNHAHESKGLKLTQQRLDLIGKLSGQELYVQVLDGHHLGKPRGTTIELTLPARL
jgi:hypothetical protein